MRVALVNRYGQTRGNYLSGLYFFRHLLTTDSYQQSYAAVLRLDDDDGNPATRSPNHCLINLAFANHGLTELEAGCVDTPVEPSVPVDQSLTLAMLNEVDGVKILASADQAESIELCFDQKETCLASNQVDVSFEKIGVYEGKVIFSALSDVDPVSLQEFTLVARDQEGQAVGARGLKFVEK